MKPSRVAPCLTFPYVYKNFLLPFVFINIPSFYAIFRVPFLGFHISDFKIYENVQFYLIVIMNRIMTLLSSLMLGEFW